MAKSGAAWGVNDCWWFKNPTEPPADRTFVGNSAINYQEKMVSRISEPSIHTVFESSTPTFVDQERAKKTPMFWGSSLAITWDHPTDILHTYYGYGLKWFRNTSAFLKKTRYDQISFFLHLTFAPKTHQLYICQRGSVGWLIDSLPVDLGFHLDRW